MLRPFPDSSHECRLLEVGLDDLLDVAGALVLHLGEELGGFNLVVDGPAAYPVAKEDTSVAENGEGAVACVVEVSFALAVLLSYFVDTVHGVGGVVGVGFSQEI